MIVNLANIGWKLVYQKYCQHRLNWFARYNLLCFDVIPRYYNLASVCDDFEKLICPFIEVIIIFVSV